MDFKALPKIELHAHLTGSVSRQTLHDIWARKKQAGETDLEDPLVVMPEGKHDYNLKTFFPLFSAYIYALLTDPASLSEATRAVLRDFAADGVVYLELRTTPRATKAPDGRVLMTRETYVRTVLDAIRAYEFESESESEPASVSKPSRPSLRTNLILSVDRRDTISTASETINLAICLADEAKTAKKNAEGGKAAGTGTVVGVDLCGDPTARTALDTAPRDGGNGVEAFTPLFARARDHGLGITVHFAEAPCSGTDGELATLLSWRPGRLGHVIWLGDGVEEAVRRRGRDLKLEGEGGIGLELCLSCNILAGMTREVDRGFEGHHFGAWFGAEGCCVCLSTDDVGVFGSPLSNEYKLAAEHFRLSDEQVRQLARQPIEVIFGGEDEKARLRKIMYLS